MIKVMIVLETPDGIGELERRTTWGTLPDELLPAVRDVLDAAGSALDGLLEGARTWPPTGLEHK